MNFTRTATSTATPFVLISVKEYLRIDHDDEDPTITAMASTAAAEIEAACGLALLSQTITCTTDRWPGCMIDLPVGPVAEGATVTVAVIEADGSLTPVTSGWWLEAGRYPRLHFTTIPGAPLRITYPAGFGDSAASIPADLLTAICDQTLRLFETRGADPMPGVSPAAARIIARHRRVRA